ncbi:MAG TPA: serine hydrolase domain-containing protein [Pyrinomonadaceae bacterium]|nr:serine hydrolase domain-containing protein [Pyrinomonadaceae bacterium]
MKHNRRDFLKYSLFSIGTAPFLTDSIKAQTTDDAPLPTERQAMRQAAETVMKDHSIPGLSMAIVHRGKMVYTESLGFANRESNEKVTDSHLFRIASISKPITSVAIFKLIEQGKISLEDSIFGQNGILQGDYGKAPFKTYVEQIQLKHLLTHTCGGWSNEKNDPMFMNPKMNHQQLINWTINNLQLTNPPGQNYAYSNFGYCILGRVIEKITGKSYENFVNEAILSKCDISDMQIGGNTLAERNPNEVIYYNQQGDSNPYGMNVRRMDSHGGWLATASDLVKFAVHVDGQAPARNILKPASIKEMTTPTTASPNYAKGWAVNKYSNWWHAGALPGTSTVMVRTKSNFCWAALTNTREIKADTNLAIDKMMWEIAAKVKGWNA